MSVWTTEKTVALPKPKRHPHKPSPVSPGFVAPIPASHLSFSPIALAGAIARTTTTLGEAPIELLEHEVTNALSRLKFYIRDGRIFELSTNLKYLVDCKLTHLAGEVGAGIAHLYMESLGYKWRADARCLSSRNPHGDFLYDGGNVAGHGVVLAEAHGSFSKQATQARIDKECEGKYLRQVKPWVGGASPHGRVIHGYSVAFACQPGTPGALVALSETRINKPRKKSSVPPATAPGEPRASALTSMALTTHRSNFILMGARPVAQWIDWLRGAGELPAEREVDFVLLEYAGRLFLVKRMPPPYGWWLYDDYDWPHLWAVSATRPGVGLFVTEESAGERFLNELSAMIGSDRESHPGRLELPVFNPEGFGFGGETAAPDRETPEGDYALFCDGLALLGTPNLHPFRRSIIGRRFWSPKNGLQ
jgi:hypothetical protein